jgi:ADP-ribose pyrophosphatase
MPDHTDQPAHPDFPVTASEVLLETPRTRVRVDTVRMPDGEARREIVEHRSAVGAVAIDDDDQVVLVRQYRHAFGERMLEIPAGLLDVEGEAVDAAMQRELAEEVQLSAGRLEHLVTFRTSAGWTTEQSTVLLATNLRPVQRPDGFDVEHEEADMAVLRVPFHECLAMVRDGRIVDSKTIVGLLAVADRRSRG